MITTVFVSEGHMFCTVRSDTNIRLDIMTDGGMEVNRLCSKLW